MTANRACPLTSLTAQLAFSPFSVKTVCARPNAAVTSSDLGSSAALARQIAITVNLRPLAASVSMDSLSLTISAMPLAPSHTSVMQHNVCNALRTA
jgi:hypothetical protein